MARAAPGVDRVISVLNFFAEHPDYGFSLTEVIRALQLNRATCHGLLGSLSDAGYLYRDLAKKYRMGPALAAIGRIAHQSFAPVAAARDEMRGLADRYDVSCIASSRVGNEMIFLERMVSRSNLEPMSPPRQRNTITPPGGSSFIAWSPQHEIDAWLASFRPPLDPGARDNVTAALTRIRNLRFSYSIPNLKAHDPADPIAHMAAGIAQRGTELAYMPEFAAELEPDRRYTLAYLSSPVFGVANEVLFTLSLYGFKEVIEGRRILEIGSDLRASAERTSAALNPRGATMPRNAHPVD